MNSITLGQPKVQKGFSLIEIMVALALGAIILLGVTEIFTANSQTRAEIERTGLQIESGSYALGLIESDLTNAAFWGEAGEQPEDPLAPLPPLPPVCPGLGPINPSDPNDPPMIELRDSLAYPLQGEDAGGSCVEPKDGSEFIAVRRASSCPLGSAGCDPADSNFYLQVNSCFDQSDSSADQPGDLLINTDLSYLDYTQRDCLTAAPQYRLLSRVYFVNEDDELVRAELSRASGASAYVETPLVRGVETMNFEYGLDTNGDGQVDVHTDSPAGVEWADVVMVRVYMVVRNLEPSGGYSDTRTYVVGGDAYNVPAEFMGHKRQVYARTVSIRNVAGRREAQ